MSDDKNYLLEMYTKNAQKYNTSKQLSTKALST